MQPFIDPAFAVPEGLETETYRLRMLRATDVEKDFEAVISSIQELTQVWPASGWPKGLTLEENRRDLQRHEREFMNREAFAYTVVALDESRVLGCVYINPSSKQGYEAEVYLWHRESPLGEGADLQLQGVVDDWLKQQWPFSSPILPGRQITWQDWHKLPNLEL